MATVDVVVSDVTVVLVVSEVCIDVEAVDVCVVEFEGLDEDIEVDTEVLVVGEAEYGEESKSKKEAMIMTALMPKSNKQQLARTSIAPRARISFSTWAVK